MRRPITPLIALLLLQLIVAGALSLRHDPLAGTTSGTLLMKPDAVKGADEIVIEAKSAAGAAPTSSGTGALAAPASTRIVLRKKDGAWVLPDTYDVPADGARVNALLDRLTALKRGLPIATSESALRRFKLTDGDFERRLILNAAGKVLSTVYFGSSPGLRKADARTAEDQAVYAVDLPTYELPTDVSAWLSEDLLKVDASKLAEIDVGGSSGDAIQLLRQKGMDKQPDSWTDPALKGDQRIDSAHVEALLQQVTQLHVESVLGTTLKPEWQQEHPAVSLTLKDEKAQSVQWVLSKPAEGDFYVLKSSAHPWFFSISAALGKQVVDDSLRDALIVAAKPSPAAAGKT